MCINLASNNADSNGKVMRQTCNSIRESICPVCGKKFIPAIMHLYKMKIGAFEVFCMKTTRALFSVGFNGNV